MEDGALRRMIVRLFLRQGEERHLVGFMKIYISPWPGKGSDFELTAHPIFQDGMIEARLLNYAIITYPTVFRWTPSVVISMVIDYNMFRHDYDNELPEETSQRHIDLPRLRAHPRTTLILNLMTERVRMYLSRVQRTMEYFGDEPKAMLHMTFRNSGAAYTERIHW